MALTPEQSMLALQQIYGSPFEGAAHQYAQANDARTGLAYKLMAMQREEQLKRDLMAEQDQRAFRLAEMQAGREDSRATAAEDRQTAALDAREKASAANDEARGKLEDKKFLERSKADLLNEFDRDYPKYADAMEAAKRPVRKREDFPETRAGLGQMQAEGASAHRAYQENLLKQAAKNGAQGIARLQTALATTDKEISALEKPTGPDEKIARARALAAIRSEIATDKDRTYEKLTASQKDKGLAALAKGNTEVATEHLGPLAIQSYDSAYEQNLMALPNQKARMAAVAQAKRNRLALQGFHEKTFSAFTGASGTNPFISEELDKLTPIQAMQLDGNQPPPQTEEEKLRAKTPPRQTQNGAGGTWAPGTEEAPAQPGIIRSGLSSLMNMTPGARTLQRTVGNAVGAIRTPATLDDFGRSLTGLQRWFSPDSGSVTDETTEVVTPTEIDVTSLLQERPAGPWNESELRAIREFTNKQAQGPNLLQRMFPGAR